MMVLRLDQWTGQTQGVLHGRQAVGWRAAEVTAHPAPHHGAPLCQRDQSTLTPSHHGRVRLGAGLRLTAHNDALLGARRLSSHCHIPAGGSAEAVTALGFPALLPPNLIAGRHPPLQPRHEPTLN